MSNSAGRPRIYGDVTLTCRQCEQPFTMRGSEARGYEKKHGKPKPFCSMACFYQASERHPRDLTEEAPTYVCAGCKKVTIRRRDMLGGERVGHWDMRQKYCTSECFHTSNFSERQDARDRGVLPIGSISKEGYHIVKMAHGKNVKVHRIVMERILGRPLRDNENVHHLNGVRSDNDPANLELWVKTQPCGQRVQDKVTLALSLLRDYPEFLAELGCRIVSTEGDGNNELAHESATELII